ncbi:RNA polymerase sigma-70 factor (ECF subfamily) [Sphingomonas sp. BE123]|jgi:RNA polymerase sigma-70 factor (ECF subfamily)|uniref:RNA polymerase sigma factor n=1 Tax=Sphingomonas sp. BE123 TaxID=2817842 RepID=UPI002865026D|nr:RNA polymerase sigma factor [Sphingomonas sp. BE123]MDR6852969.1 RNA polymerase sigma-70 factor (ECF subfamily) [Sphingomonas sp. BE123]
MNGETRAVERATDAWLVVAAQAGDRRAMARLVARWHRRLVAHGWRLTGDRALAEEAVQAAWIDIVRGLNGLRDERAFPAWAYRIVTRKTGAAIGDRVAGRALATALEDAPVPAPPGPDASVEQSDLRRAVAALPPGHRAAVALHYFEGLSIAETAVALGIPAGTVKTRLMHARARLRTQLEGDSDA